MIMADMAPEQEVAEGVLVVVAATEGEAGWVNEEAGNDSTGRMNVAVEEMTFTMVER